MGAPSREAIESAYEEIMHSERWHRRLKRGMMRVDRRNGALNWQEDHKRPMGRINGMLDPTLNTSNVLNKGLPYAVFSIWTTIQFSAWADVILPMIVSLGFSVYTIIQKRNVLNAPSRNIVVSPVIVAVIYIAIATFCGGLIGSGIKSLCATSSYWSAILPSLTIIFLHFVAATF